MTSSISATTPSIPSINTTTTDAPVTEPQATTQTDTAKTTSADPVKDEYSTEDDPAKKWQVYQGGVQPPMKVSSQQEVAAAAADPVGTAAQLAADIAAVEDPAERDQVIAYLKPQIDAVVRQLPKLSSSNSQSVIDNLSLISEMAGDAGRATVARSVSSAFTGADPRFSDRLAGQLAFSVLSGQGATLAVGVYREQINAGNSYAAHKVGDQLSLALDQIKREYQGYAETYRSMLGPLGQAVVDANDQGYSELGITKGIESAQATKGLAAAKANYEQMATLFASTLEGVGMLSNEIEGLQQKAAQFRDYDMNAGVAGLLATKCDDMLDMAVTSLPDTVAGLEAIGRAVEREGAGPTSWLSAKTLKYKVSMAEKAAIAGARGVSYYMAKQAANGISGSHTHLINGLGKIMRPIDPNGAVAWKLHTINEAASNSEAKKLYEEFVKTTVGKLKPESGLGAALKGVAFGLGALDLMQSLGANPNDNISALQLAQMVNVGADGAASFLGAIAADAMSVSAETKSLISSASMIGLGASTVAAAISAVDEYQKGNVARALASTSIAAGNVMIMAGMMATAFPVVGIAGLVLIAGGAAASVILPKTPDPSVTAFWNAANRWGPPPPQNGGTPVPQPPGPQPVPTPDPPAAPAPGGQGPGGLK